MTANSDLDLVAILPFASKSHPSRGDGAEDDSAEASIQSPDAVCPEDACGCLCGSLRRTSQHIGFGYCSDPRSRLVLPLGGNVCILAMRRLQHPASHLHMWTKQADINT